MNDVYIIREKIQEKNKIKLKLRKEKNGRKKTAEKRRLKKDIKQS